MPRTTSNLTNTELRRIFEVNENSPLFEHIKQISNNYLSLYQERRRWRNLSNDIKREIILIWKDFVDKYGPNRNDMNEIKERSQTGNYNLSIRGAPETETHGVYWVRELLRWNREECTNLISILEYEDLMREEARIKPNRKKHKSKRKSKPKRKKHKSKNKKLRKKYKKKSKKR